MRSSVFVPENAGGSPNSVSASVPKACARSPPGKTWRPLGPCYRVSLGKTCGFFRLCRKNRSPRRQHRKQSNPHQLASDFVEPVESRAGFPPRPAALPTCYHVPSATHPGEPALRACVFRSLASCADSRVGESWVGRSQRWRRYPRSERSTAIGGRAGRRSGGAARRRPPHRVHSLLDRHDLRRPDHAQLVFRHRDGRRLLRQYHLVCRALLSARRLFLRQHIRRPIPRLPAARAYRPRRLAGDLDRPRLRALVLLTIPFGPKSSAGAATLPSPSDSKSTTSASSPTPPRPCSSPSPPPPSSPGAAKPGS